MVFSTPKLSPIVLLNQSTKPSYESANKSAESFATGQLSLDKWFHPQHEKTTVLK
jgi:hypothetical protein